MSNGFLDNLPSQEREKIRKRLRSPEAYERLREKVKGPEDLAEEMDRSEKLAELHFSMESDPRMRESVKNAVVEDAQTNGLEQMLDAQPSSPDVLRALREGRFTVAVAAHPETQEDTLVLVPEGNVQEKIPLTQNMSERYAGQFLMQR